MYIQASPVSVSAFEHVYAIRRLGGAGVSATVPRRDWESCCVESRREPLNLDAKCWVDAAAIRLELRGDAANEPVRSRQRVGARAALLVTVRGTATRSPYCGTGSGAPRQKSSARSSPSSPHALGVVITTGAS